MRVRRASTLLVFVLLFLCPAVLGDEVVLKGGRRLTGKIVEEDETTVVLLVTGVGKITLGRSEIEKIIRSEPGAGKEEAPEKSDLLRVEDSFVWSGERRLGTRSVRVRRLADGNLSFQEETVFFDEKGREDVKEFLVETVKPDLDPVSLLYRTVSKDGLHRLEGTVREGELLLAVSLPGKRRTGKLKLPEGVRFPLAAREHVIRERTRIRGSFVLAVFDPREENFFKHTYRVSPPRKMAWQGGTKSITVILRQRGDRSREEIWVDGAGNVLTEQLNGTGMTAVRTSPARLQAFREGRKVPASAEERRVRPVFVHPEAGFRLRKPTLSWEFTPGAPGDTQVLSVSNLRCFAYVEVFLFPDVPEGGLLSSLAVDMEKRCRASSKDFEKLSEGYLEVGGVRAYRMEVASTNKGEKLRSWLVGLIHGKRTWLITMSSPRAYWKEAVPDFEEFLASFDFIREEK